MRVISADSNRTDCVGQVTRLVATGEDLASHGRWHEAEASLRQALALEPLHSLTRRHLALLLIRIDRVDEAVPLLHAELATADGPQWIDECIASEMSGNALTVAGCLAEVYARLRWGSRWCHAGIDLEPPAETPNPLASAAKFEHDALQLRYLLKLGRVPTRMNAMADAYDELATRLRLHGITGQLRLDEEDRKRVDDVFNRLVFVRPTPRIGRALSSTWDAAVIERAYLERSPGVVVIDDFLMPEALAEVRAFCLESTVWFANRYAHGRLGAFFRDGFNCPLLLQIAEELRAALPNVIGERFPLRQLWGFKNSPYLPADSTTHADFAAVNVNFWITPEEANQNDRCGGMTVYEVDAPLEWDFHTYNGSPELIHDYLRRQRARRIRIPYKANRAIIFNSDLFHGTEEVRFGPDYTDRRINVTMLYGQREGDVHHAPKAPTAITETVPSWRSAAFTRRRR